MIFAHDMLRIMALLPPMPSNLPPGNNRSVAIGNEGKCPAQCTAMLSRSMLRNLVRGVPQNPSKYFDPFLGQAVFVTLTHVL